MCCWLKQSFFLIICKMAMEVKKNDDIVVTLIAFSRKHGHFAFRIKMWDMSIQCLYSLFYCSRTWCLCLWLGYLLNVLWIIKRLILSENLFEKYANLLQIVILYWPIVSRNPHTNSMNLVLFNVNIIFFFGLYIREIDFLLILFVH